MSLATPTFHAGQHGKFKIPGTTAIDLPTSKWDFTIKGNNKDVSNSRDGRFRVPGLPDFEGSFMLPYDTANDPSVTANGGLVVGATIVFNAYVDDTHFWALTSIIDEIGAASEIEGEVMFPVKFSCQSGTAVPPIYP